MTAYEYLDQFTNNALTKEEHDRLAAGKSRPVSDPGYRPRRHRNVDLGPDAGGNVTIRHNETEPDK